MVQPKQIWDDAATRSEPSCLAGMRDIKIYDETLRWNAIQVSLMRLCGKKVVSLAVREPRPLMLDHAVDHP